MQSIAFTDRYDGPIPTTPGSTGVTVPAPNTPVRHDMPVPHSSVLSDETVRFMHLPTAHIRHDISCDIIPTPCDAPDFFTL